MQVEVETIILTRYLYKPVKLRLDADVLAALRASGDGWQTRINETLRAALKMAGRI